MTLPSTTTRPGPPTRPSRRPRRRTGVVALGLVALFTTATACTSVDSPAPASTTSTSTVVRAPTADPRPTTDVTPGTSPRPTADATRTPTSRPTSEASSGAAPGAGTALAVLAALPVKGRAPMTGYARDQFGPAWADVDRNGCDTRNDVLGRDLDDRAYRPGTHGCIVTSGNLPDPYTGRTIAFTRGVTTSTAVQIDHVVALADAWRTGAQQLAPSTRELLANDPLNLLAVDGPTNEQKSDGDAATWLPPSKAYRCEYVARQEAVKKRYHLWVTPPERDAIRRVLLTCPRQRIPVGGLVGAAIVAQKGPSGSSGGSGSAGGSGAGHPAVTAPISRHDCPSWAPIKGNESSHIYHLPGGAYYDRTNPEVCFATEAAAQADGYRASKR